MALFSSKKKTEVAKPVEAPKKVSGPKVVSLHDKGEVILRPRITEKASAQAELGTYVFEILPKANKKDVTQAIFEVYKVKPVAVRITKNPAKTVFVRGKIGSKPGVKKAYVTLKAGDKIEFV